MVCDVLGFFAGPNILCYTINSAIRVTSTADLKFDETIYLNTLDSCMMIFGAKI